MCYRRSECVGAYQKTLTVVHWSSLSWISHLACVYLTRTLLKVPTHYLSLSLSLSLSLFISYISLQNLTVGMLLRGLFILHPEFYYPLSKKFSHKYVRSIIENYSLSRKLTAFSFLRLLKGSNLSKNYVYFRLWLTSLFWRRHFWVTPDLLITENKF